MSWYEFNEETRHEAMVAIFSVQEIFSDDPPTGKTLVEK